VNLNSNFFFQRKRIYKGAFDDVKGHYVGHALVIAGYNKEHFYIVDPSPKAPKKNGKYWVDQDFVITSILLHNPYIAAIWK